MSWLSNIFRRRSIYNDLSEELRQHLDEKTEQLMRSEGLSREQAALRARVSFGNRTVIEERSRETWQWMRIENLLRDVKFSARLLWRSPGFTLIAILTLTLGIGANTAVFSLLNGLLLRPLPVPNARQLAVLRMQASGLSYGFCYPLFQGLQKRHDLFTNIFAFDSHTFQYHSQNGDKPVDGALVSGEFFSGLGTSPELGRTITAADDHKGNSAFGAVISDGFWSAYLHRDPKVLGRKLTLDGVTFTVVGVMPPSFYGAEVTARPEIYVPLSAEPLVESFDMLDSGYRGWWLSVGATRKPGVTLAQANAALQAASSSLVNEAIPDPNWSSFETKRQDIRIAAEDGTNGYSYLRDQYRKPLLLVFGLCVLTLLLACVNLASLLLARSAVREREIATRLAIGATRARLIQQLLIDSLLLALLGTGLGLAVAPLVSRLLVAMLTSSRDNTIYLDASLDWRGVLFAACAAILSTLLVGLLPAIQSTAGDLIRPMKDGSRGTQRHAHGGLLSRGLLALEVALAMLLVTGSGLLGSSLYRLYHSGLGFDAHNLLEVPIDPDHQSLQGDALMHMYDDISARIATLPGVRAVAYASIPPISGQIGMTSMHAPGAGDQFLKTNSVSPGYFAAMRTPRIDGRDFTLADRQESSTNILINRAAAQLFYPSGHALGKTLVSSGDKKKQVRTIAGIVEDAKYASLKEPAPPTVYIPARAWKADAKPSFTVMVRYTGTVGPLVSAIRSLIHSVSADIPDPAFFSMEKAIDDSISAERVMALLAVFFGISALLVTGIGLYGVLAYSTARRTNEIGIRMALGAARAQMIQLVFRENAWVALTGCVAGLVAAFFASRLLATSLYGISPHDPWVLATAMAALCLIAAAASLIPALRAASVDPMGALRTE